MLKLFSVCLLEDKENPLTNSECSATLLDRSFYFGPKRIRTDFSELILSVSQV